MTYTYKLARRLAISRNFAMLSVFVLLAGCMGETTGPEADTASSLPQTPIAFRVVPSAVTIETQQAIRFRGESQTRRGERYSSRLSWESSGGTIHSDGTFSARLPGTYKVVGRGRGRQRPDTSVVVVVPPLVEAAAVEIAPDTATVAAGSTHSFVALGRLPGGGTAPIGVVWSATGGSIDPSGVYTAGSSAGSHRVVASNTAGTLADTAAVRITPAALPDPVSPADPDPDPTPTPEPPPAVTRLVLVPASVSLPAGLTKQFAAYGRTGAGDSVAVAVSFSATGGSITPTGLYTAGSTAGTYQVTATSSGLSGTATVTVPRALSSGGARAGVPFGPFNLFGEGIYTKTTSGSQFNLTLDGYTPENIVGRLEQARAKGLRLMLAMTSGSHSRYKTDGVFDMAKWVARMNTYNTPTIKAAIAAGVADGTIIGNEVMDEPQNRWGANSWGPEGTMTKARVDQMCGYVKNMFPTLPVGVTHDQSAFEPLKSYTVCEFIVSQYRWSKTKGNIQAFRDAGLALARRDGIAIAFSLNILDGGVPNPDASLCAAGRGTVGNDCRMTADQIRNWGKALGTAGCALFMWRYDAEYMSRPENVKAFNDVAAALASTPAPPCRRS